MCPLCQYPYRCPCEACKDRNNDSGIKKWIRLEGDFQDCEACPCCGLVLHLDQWEDLSWQEAKEQYKLSNQCGGCLSGIVDEKDKLI